MKLETIVFQVTTRCPFACPQCYMQRGNRDLLLHDGKQMMNRLRASGGSAVQFTGGEPLVHRELPALIEYAKQNDLLSMVATSGFRQSAETYQELMDKGLDVLCVSLNDMDAGRNAATRESYDDSLAAIKTACKIGMCCCVNVVVTDQNIDNLEKLSEHLFGLGVAMIVFLRPVPSFDGKYVPSVSLPTVQKLDELVKKEPELLIVESCFKEYWEYVTGDSFVCRDAGVTTVFVNADGTLSPCSQLQQYRYTSMEEMLKERDVWRGGCR